MHGSDAPRATRASELLELAVQNDPTYRHLERVMRQVVPTVSLGDPLDWYRTQARNRFERFEVKGLGQAGRQIWFPLTLNELYVCLLGREHTASERERGPGGRYARNTPKMDDGRTGQGLDKVEHGQHPDDREHGQDLEGGGSVPLEEAFERLQRQHRDRYFRGMVFLGDPGSGKTILLQRLLMTCLDHGSSTLGLPWDLIPVLLPLRSLPRTDAPLDDFLLCALGIRDASLKGTLEEVGHRLTHRDSRVLLLLDGLDEVADPARRQEVMDWIQQRLQQRPEWRFAVTSRYAGYKTGDLGPLFLEYHIQEFTPPQAREFTQHWFTLVEFHKRSGATERAASEGRLQSDALWGELEQDDARSRRVRDMTKNPLLLTCLCLVQLRNGTLPRRRSELYELCVGIFLKDWRAEWEADFPFQVEEARALLEPVASWMQRREKGLEAHEDELVTALRWPLMNSFRNPFKLRPFLKWVENRSGLLVGVGQGRYAFLHRTFQEYLAARAWRGHGQVTELAGRFDDKWWEEVVLLLLALDDPKGRQFTRFVNALMRSGGWERASHQLDACLEEASAPTLAPFVKALKWAGLFVGGSRWAHLIAPLVRGLTGGRVLTDPAGIVAVLRLAETVVRVREELKEGPAGQALKPTADRLLSSPDPGIRIAAGALLSRLRGSASLETLLGRMDLAAGTVAIHPKSGLEFVFVPGGELQMGSRESSDEKPIHQVTLQPFWMGRFPVTNEQYGRFLEETKRDAPAYWTDSTYNGPRQPVVGVNWEEALAFAEWAGRELASVGRGKFALPSEAQWEYVARGAGQPGTDSRRYPWGDQEPTPELANYDASKIGRSTPVGSYPLGASWCGCEDLSGNVWEWCADAWHDNYVDAPVDGSAWMSDDDQARRVVRGGGWDCDAVRLRGAYRSWWLPRDWYVNLGFRVVLSAVSPAGRPQPVPSEV